MNTSDHDTETIFLQAQQLPAGEREQFLRTVCGDREDLRCRVNALLEADAEPGGFLPDAPVSAPANLTRPHEEPGAIIGRYKLLQKLGEGGMGSVWMAEQREPILRRVALKIIKLGMDSHEVVARFEQERQALAMMDHPAIAKVLDAGATDNGRPYFVMELVRGVPLTAFCDERKLDVPARLALFVQICQAIQHAHQKGIIHRDIKPSNILVTAGDDSEPLPKIIDFGIAKATGQVLTDKTLFTKLDQIIGTPAYMSPEQAGLGPLDIDTRSDVYALGVLLYELLTGRPPFDPKSLMQAGLDEMRRVIREDEPPRPSTRVGSLTGEELSGTAARRHLDPPKLVSVIRGDLDWIVMKALEKNRNRRYETASGFAADVQRFLSHEPVTARPPSTFYVLSRLVGRHRIAFAAGGAVLTAILLGIAGATWGFFRAEDARIVAQRRQSEAEAATLSERQARDQTAGLLSAAQVERGVRMLMDHDPAGLLYLVEARRPVEHLPALRDARTILCQGWIDSLASKEVLALPTVTGSKKALEFSPDGRLLAVGGNPELKLFDLAKPFSPAVIRTQGGADRIFFSPSGTFMILQGSHACQVWHLDQSGNYTLAAQWQPRRHTVDKREKPWGLSRNRRWLLLPLDGGIKRMDLETGESHSLGAAGQEAASAILLCPTDDGRRLFMSGEKDLRVVDLENPAAASTVIVSRSIFKVDKLFAAPDGAWVCEGYFGGMTRYDLTGGSIRKVQDRTASYSESMEVTADGNYFLTATNTPVPVTEEGYFFQPASGIVRGHEGFRMFKAYGSDEFTGEPFFFELPGGVRASASTLSPAGTLLALGAGNGVTRVWNWKTGQILPLHQRDPAGITAVAISPDGKRLATLGSDHITRVHALPAKGSSLPDPRPAQTVPLLAASNNRILISSGETAALSWLDAATGRVDKLFASEGGGEPFFAAASRPDGSLVATLAGNDKTQAHLQWWKDGTPGPGVPVGPMSALTLSPDGTTLAGFRMEDAGVTLWNVQTQQESTSLKRKDGAKNTGAPSTIRFSPDKRWLAAVWPGVVYVWELATGQPLEHHTTGILLRLSGDWRQAITSRGLADFTNPRNPVLRHQMNVTVNIVDFTTDGRFAVLQPEDHTIQVFNTSSGLPASLPIQLTQPRTLPVVFSPDGNLMILEDALRRTIYDVSTGLPCGLPVEAAAPIGNLLITPDSRYLYCETMGSLGSIEIVKLPVAGASLAALEHAAQRIARARLTPAGTIESLTAEELARPAPEPP